MTQLPCNTLYVLGWSLNAIITVNNNPPCNTLYVLGWSLNAIITVNNNLSMQFSSLVSQGKEDNWIVLPLNSE